MLEDRTAGNRSESTQAQSTAPVQARTHADGPNVASIGWAHEVSAGGAGFTRIGPGNAGYSARTPHGYRSVVVLFRAPCGSVLNCGNSRK
jgi:hypothetical protein